jgi:ribosome-associated protein
VFSREALATNMIQVTDTIAVNESEIQLEFIRASGPGGQNVNKVSSAVQLRFDAAGSSTINDAIYARLKKIAGRRMTAEGVLIIKANRFRSQEKNRQDAVNRFILLIQSAIEKPKHRHPTRPPAASKQRRLAAKRHRGEIKRRRKTIPHSGEES